MLDPISVAVRKTIVLMASCMLGVASFGETNFVVTIGPVIRSAGSLAVSLSIVVLCMLLR